MELVCCHIPCDTPAEYEIINTSPGADPYDVTHACVLHVGDLLGSINDAPCISWDVSVLDIKE